MLRSAVLVVFAALFTLQSPLLPPAWVPALAMLCWPWVSAGRRPWLLLLAAVLSFTLLRAEDWASGLLAAECEGRELRVRGRVLDLVNAERVSQSRGGEREVTRFTLAVDRLQPSHCEGPQILRLYWESAPALRPGQWLELAVRLKLPWSLANPGLPNRQRNDLQQGVQAVGSVREPLAFGELDRRPRDRLQRFRDGLSQSLREAVPGVGGRLLAALLVGDRRFLDERDWERLRLYGITHLLVISGMHISLAAGIGWSVGTLLRRLPVGWSGHWASGAGSLLAFTAAAAYAALAGLSLPTLRALLMLLPAALLLPLGRARDGPGLLAVAVVLLVLTDPLSVLGASLWLSAGAVALLLWLSRWRPGERWLTRLAVTQLFMLVAMLPLGLLWFGEASSVGALVNLVAVPLVGLWVVPIGLLGVLCSALCQSLSVPLWQCAAWPLEQLWWGLTHWEPVLRDLSGITGQPGLSLTALALVAVLLLPLPATMGRFVLVALLGLPLLLMNARPTASLDVLVFDVGQGTSVLVRDGDTTLLYDTGGGRPERPVLSYSVLPYLRGAGVDHIDRLVISHEDSDHSAGVQRLADRLTVRERWVGAGSLRGDWQCRPGAVRQLSPRIRTQVLNGPHPGDSDNNGSCVLLLEISGARLLLAGDIDARRERELVARWGGQLQADLLLASHHGSGGSSSRLWLRHVRPRHVIATAGRGNRFGHPALRVREAVEAVGARLWTTAEHGALRVRIGDGGGISVIPTRHRWRPFYWLWDRGRD